MPSPSEQLVLKEGGVFLLTDDAGNITGNEGLGLYYQDTRFLSHFTFDLGPQEPELLNYSSSLNFLGTLQFANRAFRLQDNSVVLPQTINISRRRFISDGLHEKFSFNNYNPFPVPVRVSLTFGCDFRDIFDVRGFVRKEWGKRLRPVVDDKGLYLGYEGQDGIKRGTLVSFDRQPNETNIEMPENMDPVFDDGLMVTVIGEPSFHVTVPSPKATLTWNFSLEPFTPFEFSLHVQPQSGDAQADAEAGATATDAMPINGGFDHAIEVMRASYQHWGQEGTQVKTSNEQFNQLLERSKYDLRVLCQEDDGGYFPAAGIPWYVCPFGRDSIIVALQTLMFNPKIAVGTLRTLARYQGKTEDAWREEQPGKILHELRQGEMAHLHMVPHTPYFGTVDATPLFVMLFVETMKWLNNENLYQELLPNVWAAVEWIDKYGDVDSDGFVEYVASDKMGGIRNQVWKDSNDSIQFPDRTLAETPIAAVEVQGYVFAAKKGFADLLRQHGDNDNAARLDNEAEALKKRFNEVFWLDENQFYTQGLDKDKTPVPTISSNPGHALWTGIADEDKAARVVQRMLEPDMLSGWGLRTISDKSASYNPMSYHNGSVWPHDNSLIIAGFKRYGFTEAANTVISQILEAAQHFQYSRLPELYCGFPRDLAYMNGPAEYPVSCSPQAWAAATPILMLQTMLGLEPGGEHEQLKLNAQLPEWLDKIEITNLRIGEQRATLTVERNSANPQISLS